MQCSHRFQTTVLNIRINFRKAVSDEQQESIQKLENRFRSGGMAHPILIDKSMGFSQSLSGFWEVVISYDKNQISADSD